MARNETSPEPKKPDRFNTYIRYSGLALQLFVAIGVTGWLGYKLDRYLGLNFPLFMMLFGMSAFGWILYRAYQSITRD